MAVINDSWNAQMKVSPHLSQQHLDEDFCWDLILRTRPNFRVSQPYAIRETSARLLALYAMFASLEDLTCRVADEQVARSKLAWWQVQLLGSEYASSAHPVTRQLRESGALAAPALDQIKSLLNSVGQRLDLATIVDETELRAMCILVARDQMKLEWSLQAAVPESDFPVERACAVMGLTQLMRESSLAVVPDYKWIPLTMLARFGVNRSDLVRHPDSESVRNLKKQLCVLGSNWLAEKGDVRNSPLITCSLPDTPGARHWLIQLGLCIRLLQKLPGKTRAEAHRMFSQPTVGEAWCAWRWARKLSF